MLSLQELCLHPLVAASVDPVVVLEAVQGLAPRQALALLRYLGAWLRLHGQVLGGWLHPPRRRRAGGDGGRSRRQQQQQSSQQQKQSQQQQKQLQADGAVQAAPQDAPQQAGDASFQQPQSDQQASSQPGSGGCGRSTRSKAKGRGKASSDRASDGADTAASPKAAFSGGKPDQETAPMEVEAAPAADAVAASVAASADPAARASEAAAAPSSGWPVPPLARVVEWASAVLDAQLASLPSNSVTRQVRALPSASARKCNHSLELPCCGQYTATCLTIPTATSRQAMAMITLAMLV